MPAALTDWIRQHAITAATLDPRAPLDDLEPLGDLIGSARVVAVGESAHHVREFYLLRHRLLRLLVERHGFTALAFEAPFTEAHAVDAWVRGGPGTVADVAATGAGAGGLGECTEMHDLLTWMRDHNTRASGPAGGAGGSGVEFAGTIISNRRAAVDALAGYLRAADPDAVPLLAEIDRLPDEASIFKTFPAYAATAPATQDAMTAAVSRLLCRMETMAAHQRGLGRDREHATATRHLRGIWFGDHTLRDYTGRGIPAGSSSTDAYLAESVLHLLKDHPRVLLAVHNCHLRKTPVDHEGAFGLFPAGYHLAEALGDDYLAIAVTGGEGRTAQVRPDPGHPLGFRVVDHPPAPLTSANIESASTGDALLTIADLRAARRAVTDSATYTRMRMEHYHTDVDVFDAYDAVAHVSHTTCTDYCEAAP